MRYYVFQENGNQSIITLPQQPGDFTAPAQLVEALTAEMYSGDLPDPTRSPITHWVPLQLDTTQDSARLMAAAITLYASFRDIQFDTPEDDSLQAAVLDRAEALVPGLSTLADVVAQRYAQTATDAESA